MPADKRFSEITPRIESLAKKCVKNDMIGPELYGKFDVKRGLRDINGEGVLAGLTQICEVKSSELVDGVKEPCSGELYYRGIDVKRMIDGYREEKRFGFEETAYLLLFGELPKRSELEDFTGMLAGYRTLPTNFVRDIILKAPSRDMMNTLARSVLTMYAYDANADDISPENVLRQCCQLIALFPMFSVYSYQAYKHYHDGESLFIHVPDPSMSTAENILHLLRADSRFTALEASVLDIALVLHAEHGGGNNSTFATRVITSSGTDTYSAVAAALGSLKGPRHGGANIRVVQMIEDIKQNVKDWNDDGEVAAYLERLLNKEAFDRSGLIYGMGHAVYSISDPRAEIFRQYVKSLSAEKGMDKEFALYERIETLAPRVIAEKRRIYKGVSANVDFYSGFAYSLLNLPVELYTPIFAIARIAGWAAHRLEEIVNNGKIIRPAYKSVTEHRDYIPLEARKSNMQLKMWRPDTEKAPAIPPPEGFEIRSMREGEEEAWAHCCIGEFGVDRVDKSAFEGKMAGSPPSEVFYICKDGAPVGTATALQNEGEPYLHYIAVHPEWRGKKLAKPLISKVLQRHEELGRAGCFLTTDDFRVPAISTYLQLGYRPVLRSEDAEERWLRLMELLKIETLDAYDDGKKLVKVLKTEGEK